MGKSSKKAAEPAAESGGARAAEFAADDAVPSIQQAAHKAKMASQHRARLGSSHVANHDAATNMTRQAKAVTAEGFGYSPGGSEMEDFMQSFEHQCSDYMEEQVQSEIQPNYHKTTQFAFLDISPFSRDAMSGIVRDSFTQCFTNYKRIPWDFEFYLWPMRYTSIVIRYGILLPIRAAIMLLSMLLFASIIAFAQLFDNAKRVRIKNFGIMCVVYGFMWAWCAVVVEKGTLPPRRKGQIFVANHSTVIDIVLLLKKRAYSLTGQAHPGSAIGFFQKYVLESMDNLWFDRMASKDRKAVARKIKEHIADVTKPPLLVFPEGTCVNNEYAIMFKRGAFELGDCICPVAIKYNKIFVDGYWNSREQSFPMHIFNFLVSWALVVEVTYMDPQFRLRGESSTSFATRVKAMIAKEAGLQTVPWDGYLKYFQPKPEYKKNRQKIYAKMLRQRFNLGPIPEPKDAGSSKKDK